MKRIVFVFTLLLCGVIVKAQDFADLVAKVDKSVVTIYVVEKVNQGIGDAFTQVSAEGLGSGVVVGSTGQFVLTASHVVDNASKIMVELHDGSKVMAKMFRASKTADVALIQLDRALGAEASATIGDSDKMRIGDDVFVIGAPLGLTHSVSKGIISGKRSEKMLTSNSNMMEFFQTDASINKGNSGGPMFNINGEVIGIVSSILSFSGGFEGLGFAASSNIAKNILLKRGSVWFGIDALPLNSELCKVFNVPQDGALMIQSVADKSPAYFMGLKGGYIKMEVIDSEFLAGGDIILSFDNIVLDSQKKLEELGAYLNTVEKNHKYTLKVLRGGEKVFVTWSLPE